VALARVPTPQQNERGLKPAKVFVDSRGRTLLQSVSRCTKLCGKNSEDDDVQFCTIGGAAGRFFLH